MRRWNADLPPILHADADCLVIDKPAGMAVHPGPQTADCLEARLRLGARPVPRAVHRLDRDTSGCLLLGIRPGAVRRLMAAFAEGAVEKTYLALVSPAPAADAGVIDAPLAKVSSAAAGWRIVVDRRGKPAQTAWRVLARGAAGALVELRPATGRTHQLRVHAGRLAAGAAIVGDPVYGRAEPGGLMLHAARLVFPRADGAPVAVDAPLPERFRALGFGTEAPGSGPHLAAG